MLCEVGCGGLRSGRRKRFHHKRKKWDWSTLWKQPLLLHENIGVVREVYHMSEKWSHETIELTLVRVVKFSSVTIQEGFFVHTSIHILFLIFSSIVGQHRKLLSWSGFYMSLQQHVSCLSASAHAFVAPKGVISPCSENPAWCVPISTVPTVFPSSLCPASRGSGSHVPSALLVASVAHLPQGFSIQHIF